MSRTIFGIGLILLSLIGGDVGFYQIGVEQGLRRVHSIEMRKESAPKQTCAK